MFELYKNIWQPKKRPLDKLLVLKSNMYFGIQPNRKNVARQHKAVKVTLKIHIGMMTSSWP